MHQSRQGPKSRPLAALLAAVLLAACSGGGGTTAPTTTTSTESTDPTPTTTPARTADDADWVGQGPKPVSQLVGAGDHIVYLGVDDDGLLHLVGLNPSTGQVAWSRPSTAATHIPGVEQHLVSDGDTVFNVEPPGATNERVTYPAQGSAAFDVVAVDARTGKDQWHHPFDDVRTPLEKCGDDLCVFADAALGHLNVTRLDPATGDQLSEGAEAFEPLVAVDGELAISAARDSNEIVLTTDFGRRVVWNHERAELFGSNDVTPDSGWAGFHINGVWIVWLGGPPPSIGTTSGVSDDGRLLWTRADIAPCFAVTDDPITVPVLCGTVDAVAQQLNVGTIEGVDPQTGTTVWQLPVGAVDETHPGASIVRTIDTHFVFDVAGTAVSADTITGPLGPTVALEGWCATMDDHVQAEDRQSIVARSWSPCTLGVGPTHEPPRVVPDFAGPTVSGYGAWVEDGEVRAAKVS